MTRRKAKGKRREARPSKTTSPASPSDSPVQPGSPTPASQPDDSLNEQVNKLDLPTARLTPRRAIQIVAALAAFISLGSFAYFFSNDMTNLYGDGVAHVNIARKVVDSPDESLWQRYIQIGSPWLPLQTALMLPLVANDWMWRTGFAGSVVSMISFVATALALYLLAREIYGKEDAPHDELSPAITAAIFLFNPSAVYMQSTPMTELVFMATLVLAVYLMQRWVNDQTKKRLIIAALAMMLATLARYEAWPVAALAAAIVILASRGDARTKIKNGAAFTAVALIGPAYWLWHNWAIYGDALEFLTGPYSARGLYLQNQANLGWSKIFVGHLFIDILMIAVTAAVCAGPFVLLIGAVGFVAFLIIRRRRLIENAPVILLIVPFFFHVFSLYRGEIQIFPLSAFGLHNVRYGLPHILAIALFAPSIVLLFKRESRRPASVALLAIVFLQYAYLVSEGPSQLAVYQEGYRNGVNAKPARDRRQFSSLIKADPPRPTILMNTGELGPVVSQGGLHYSDLIHEGTLRWHQINEAIPADISTVIIQEGDPLDKKLRENPALARDLAEGFQLQREVGRIRLFRRK